MVSDIVSVKAGLLSLNNPSELVGSKTAVRCLGGSNRRSEIYRDGVIILALDMRPQIISYRLFLACSVEEAF